MGAARELPPILRCRPADERDVPQLLELLAYAGWGEVDEATWHEWYRDGEDGGSEIIVAEGPEGIVGQLEFRPVVLSVGRPGVLAARGASLVLHPSIRGSRTRGSEHPTVPLYAAGREHLGRMGMIASFGLPHPSVRHTSVALVGPSQLVDFPCVRLAAVDGMRSDVMVLEAAVPEIVELWRRVRPVLPWPIAPERTPGYVARRLGAGVAVGARRRDGQLAGFAAIRRRDGLLLDVFADSDDSLHAVLDGARRFTRPLALGPSGDLAVLDHPYVHAALVALGARPVDYTFTLSVDPIDVSDEIGRAAADPRAWLVAGGD